MDLAAGVERLLERHVRRHVGVAAGVLSPDGIRTFGRGRTGRDPSTPPAADTIFEIGSVTKLFTATLLADMVLQGEVALDDPVQRYLPEPVRLPVRGRPITLVDLATHTAGLPRLPKGMLRRAVRERRNPYAGYGVRDLERALPATRLRREPGRKARYSNFGFGLLGHVLALRSGYAYEHLVLERICRPLGLEDTSIAVPPDKRVRFAQGHNRRGRPVPHWDIPALPGAGALRSSVADLLDFLGVHLGPSETRLARAALLTHEPRVRRGRVALGLGWARLPLRGRRAEVLFHNGGTGGFRCFAGLVKESGTAVVLSNSARPVDALGFRLLELLGER